MRCKASCKLPWSPMLAPPSMAHDVVHDRAASGKVHLSRQPHTSHQPHQAAPNASIDYSRCQLKSAIKKEERKMMEITQEIAHLSEQAHAQESHSVANHLGLLQEYSLKMQCYYSVSLPLCMVEEIQWLRDQQLTHDLQQAPATITQSQQENCTANSDRKKKTCTTHHMQTKQVCNLLEELIPCTFWAHLCLTTKHAIFPFRDAQSTEDMKGMMLTMRWERFSDQHHRQLCHLAFCCLSRAYFWSVCVFVVSSICHESKFKKALSPSWLFSLRWDIPGLFELFHV